MKLSKSYIIEGIELPAKSSIIDEVKNPLTNHEYKRLDGDTGHILQSTILSNLFSEDNGITWYISWSNNFYNITYVDFPLDYLKVQDKINSSLHENLRESFDEIELKVRGFLYFVGYIESGKKQVVFHGKRFNKDHFLRITVCWHNDEPFIQDYAWEDYNGKSFIYTMPERNRLDDLVKDALEVVRNWAEEFMFSLRENVLRETPTFSGFKLHYRTKFRGLNISIENRKGSYRRGIDPDGKEWKTKMVWPYGYIRGTEGVDGDHLDLFLGPDKKSDIVYVVHQIVPDTGEFDEDKCMIAFSSKEEAKEAYLIHYDSPKYFGSIEEISFDEFKEMILDTYKGKKVTKIEEKYNGNVKHIYEITLEDLRASDITSDTTKKFKGARQSGESNKTANINTKFISSEIVGNDIRFKFLTEASIMTAVTDPTSGEVKHVKYIDDDPNHKYQRVIPGTDKLELNPSASYEVWINIKGILGPDGWLSAYDEDKETITQDMMKDILKVADVQVWDDTPAYLFQGFSYWLTQLEASIFPENRKPKRWNKIHGEGENFLDKHMSGLLDQLKFFIPIMSSSMTNLLRKAGIIKPYQRKKKSIA